jgi:hypothetical protein
MADTEPLLDLTTLVERPFISIDGQKYELVTAGEMSPLDFHRLMRRIQEIQAVEPSTAGEPELVRVAKLWDELCRSVLLAPDDIHTKLKDHHRTAILRAFTQLQHEAAARARSDEAAAGPSGTTSIGAN